MTVELNEYNYNMLCREDRDRIEQFLLNMDTNNLCVIRVDTYNNEIYLFGCYENTPEWVENYKKLGGNWEYKTFYHYEKFIPIRICINNMNLI